MSITGNLELSKEILHKQINFICQDEEHRSGNSEDSLYSGKNYSVNLMRKFDSLGIDLKRGVNALEERFMEPSDKDFLTMIIDSMNKGQRV